jgi:hypothetical protein
MPSDSRTLVDRLLDRIKNNRIAAVLILACIGLGAAASLTDSTRKLAAAVSSLGGSGSTSVAGEWKSGVAAFYPSFGEEFMRLSLQEAAGDQIVGAIQFSGNEDIRPRSLPVVEGKRNGKTFTLVFDSGYRVSETIVGELAGNELRLVYQWPGRGAVAATASRIDQAPQLLDGRYGILYKQTEYPEPRAACTEMLKELNPPQAYKLSEPPDEYGNVRCAGQMADGHDGFDQIQNEVRQKLICPANSRTTLVGGKKPAKTEKGCECDGAMVASGAQCVARS